MEEITDFEKEMNTVRMWCSTCKSWVKIMVRDTKAICINCWDTIGAVVKCKDLLTK